MAFAPGTSVGSYEIAALLGKGGMGEVWKARDAKLGRDVAIKVLPEEFARNEDRLARFQREAKVLASLNHPNIAAIYGLEEVHGARCLILELVEGETVAERLTRGPIPVEESIQFALQIAAALEAAHEKSVIHRDLKPANIKVTPEGRVKVLDFGLAKALAGDGGNVNASNSPTLSMAATQQGIILGTAAYMSAEQARGRTADKRADVWAFGCVLYEMLTGKRAFDGADVSEVLAGVIKSEPAWTELPADLPPVLRVFLRRCLEKDPKRRIHDIADVRLALEGAFDVPAAAPPASLPARARTGWPKMVGVGVGAAAAGVLATALFLWATSDTAPPPLLRFSATPSAPLRLARGDTFAPDLAITPDGRRIVYVVGDSAATQQLYVRALDRLDGEALRGITGARSPFVSPDGNWVGFFDGAGLKKVAINGGPAITLCSVRGAPRGANWVDEETIIFATADNRTGLMRVSASGGEPETLTQPQAEKGELDHILPDILPGGRAVLFTIVPRTGPVENSQIAVLDLATREQKVLIRGGSHPRYIPSGHIVYGVAGTLRAVAFDPDRLEVRGDPAPVVERVLMKSTGATDFAVSPAGALIYASGDSSTLGVERALVWVDRQGREEPVGAPPRAYAYPRISPDGTRAALDIRDQENDIWVWDFMRRTLTRLTFDPGLNRGAAWTPDGRRLAFSAQRDGAETIYWQAADGTGSAERLTEGSMVQVPKAFLPDGKRLLFMQPDAPPYDIGIVTLDGQRKVELLLKASFNESDPEISPDGRWLAYESNESRQLEIYVRPFPDINGGRWQISVGGGSRPVWARNGRELFYYVVPGKVMAVPIQSGSSFTAGNPQVLFEGPYLSPQDGRTYDVSPDGRRFLMIKDARPAASPESPPPQLVVVLNWIEELKRLVPTGR